MKKVKVNWSVDLDEVLEYFENLDCGEAAKQLGITVEEYDRLSLEEVDDLIKDKFNNKAINVTELLGLDSIVIVPDDIFDDDEELEEDEIMDEIVDWLSSEYGYCVENVTLL